MILVTGATGHTGSRLVKNLLDQGRRVRCLLHDERNRSRIPAGAEIVSGDLQEPDVLSAALHSVATFINIAHIRFAPALIPILEREGIRRALFMSSTRRFTRFPCPSADQVIRGEEAIRNSSLDYTIIRPSMIYGGPNDNNMTKLVNHLRRWPVFPVFGNGRNLIQPVFVHDLVRVFAHCLERPETIRREYTIAGPEPITYREALSVIARALNRSVLFVPVPISLCMPLVRVYEAVSTKPRVTQEQVRRFGEYKVFDITPARRELDFSPVSFEEGIRLKLAGEA